MRPRGWISAFIVTVVSSGVCVAGVFETVPADSWMYAAVTTLTGEKASPGQTRYDFAVAVARVVHDGAGIRGRRATALRRLAHELSYELDILDVDADAVLAPSQPEPRSPDEEQVSAVEGPSADLVGSLQMWQDSLGPRWLSAREPALELVRSAFVAANQGVAAYRMTETGPPSLAWNGVLGGAELSLSRLGALERSVRLSDDPWRPFASSSVALKSDTSLWSHGVTFLTEYMQLPNGADESARVLQTNLTVSLTPSLSLTASRAQSGIRPFGEDIAWSAGARVERERWRMTAGVRNVTPDAVSAGLLGPLSFSTRNELRGWTGRVAYRHSPSLRLTGGFEGYNFDRESGFLYRRYLAGVGLTLRDRVALDFTIARAVAGGDDAAVSTYATLGVGYALSGSTRASLVMRVLESGDAEAVDDSWLDAGLFAGQVSIQF